MTFMSLTEKAVFATTSRLLVCLVLERLVHLRIHQGNETYSGMINDCVGFDLRGCVKEGWLRPEDVLPPIRLLRRGENDGDTKFGDTKEYPTPREIIFRLLGSTPGIASSALETLITELNNSIQTQLEIFSSQFEFRISAPTRNSTLLEWERGIIQGHGSHPCHRTRRAMFMDLPCPPRLELEFPRVVICGVLKTKLAVHGPYDEIMDELLRRLEVSVGKEHRVILIHSYQLRVVRRLFKDLHIIELGEIQAEAQASLRYDHSLEISRLELTCRRTITIPIFDFEYDFKLPLALITTSSLRTISPFTLANGPNISVLAQELNKDNPYLTIVHESK